MEHLETQGKSWIFWNLVSYLCPLSSAAQSPHELNYQKCLVVFYPPKNQVVTLMYLIIVLTRTCIFGKIPLNTLLLDTTRTQGAEARSAEALKFLDNLKQKTKKIYSSKWYIWSKTTFDESHLLIKVTFDQSHLLIKVIFYLWWQESPNDQYELLFIIILWL